MIVIKRDSKNNIKIIENEQERRIFILIYQNYDRQEKGKYDLQLHK